MDMAPRIWNSRCSVDVQARDTRRREQREQKKQRRMRSRAAACSPRRLLPPHRRSTSITRVPGTSPPRPGMEEEEEIRGEEESRGERGLTARGALSRSAPGVRRSPASGVKEPDLRMRRAREGLCPREDAIVRPIQRDE
jgi:hypothetical protein|uniref:Uncharacterized protein n=1 Tax=Zea mays TaxID=4577 RepID=A0A804PN84_MAIZE